MYFICTRNISKKSSWLEEWAYTDGSCQIHQGKQVTGAGTYHPATLTPSFVEPNGMGITNTINRAELAAMQPPFFTATHILPLTASRLFTKSGSPCCTLSFTVTRDNGILWRNSSKLSATHQTLYTYLKSNLTLVLLVMSARLLWPSIKQLKSTQILQTQGCYALALMAPFS